MTCWLVVNGDCVDAVSLACNFMLLFCVLFILCAACSSIFCHSLVARSRLTLPHLLYSNRCFIIDNEYLIVVLGEYMGAHIKTCLLVPLHCQWSIKCNSWLLILTPACVALMQHRHMRGRWTDRQTDRHVMIPNTVLAWLSYADAVKIVLWLWKL